ncbi:XRE family transcriptional regulator [Streptomyces marokkonensis]|uniref:XRE family transcriptional regulator n=1 Tax=Streptomyces marokkonensis TaxID=324855 RepID=UPI003CCB0125
MDRLTAEVRAHKLAEVRREQALTQRQVAASMGVSAPRVSAIEHGELDRAEVATFRA